MGNQSKIESLIEDIKYGKLLSSFDISGESEKLIDQIRVDRQSPSSLLAGVKTLRDIIEMHKEYLDSKVIDRLNETEIVYINMSTCNAAAKHGPDRIIIFDGLMEVLTFRMAILLMTGKVANCFHSVATKFNITRDQFIDFSFRALYLSIHYTKRPITLPVITSRLDEDTRKCAFVAFAGGMLFVILHELGHLVYRHTRLNAEKSQEPIPALSCDEDIVGGKQHEFEADAYAFNAFNMDARGFGLANVWYVMLLALDSEMFRGRRYNTHPFTINRINYMQTMLGAFTDPAIKKASMNMFESRLEQIRFRLANSLIGGIFTTDPCTVSECEEAVAQLCQWYESVI